MNTINRWQNEDIARGLAEFQPKPSARFHQTMQKQPWMAQPMTTPTHVAPNRKPMRRLIPVLGLLAALLIGGVVFVTPLRALAQEMLGLFTRAPREEMTDQELMANVPPVEAWQDELSLAQAEQVAGFGVWVPQQLPHEYTFNQAAYLPLEQMVISVYVAADGPVSNSEPYTSFVLAQQPTARAAGSSSMFPVGTSAAVETVQLGDATGQYVEGAWCGSGENAQALMEWCPRSDQRALRWQQNDAVFTLTASDTLGPAASLSREQMIELATTLVPPQN